MPDDGVMEVENVNVDGRYFIIGRDVKYAASFKVEIPSVRDLVRWSDVFLKYLIDKFGDFDVIVSGSPPNAKSYILELSL
jgi:hypothetical protein